MKKTGNTENWNCKMIESKIEAKLDENHIITHETYKSLNSPYKFRDFVLLKCFVVDNSNNNKNSNNANRYCIVFSSISNYEPLPEVKDKIRCILLPSGFEIKKYNNDNNQCQISYNCHMTSESILLFTPDLLGETDELFQSLIRIEELVSIYKQQMKNNK